VDAGFTNDPPDPHSEPGNACPRNFFGIMDYEQLQQVETVFALKRAVELEKKGIPGKFGSDHLRAIHQYLFQDVFPWAGELRVVNIAKGNAMFGPALHVATALDDAMAKLKREGFLAGLAPAEFARRAGFYLGEINAIHPFREGNGRAQREFIRQLAIHADHPLSWAVAGAGFTQQQVIDASILSHTRGDNAQLAAIIEAALLSTRARRARTNS
jgi:cell filamentation protein